MPPDFELSYRPDLGIITARWYTDSPLADLQRRYQELVAKGQVHNCSRWLIDVRRRAAPSLEAAAWVTEQWLPATVAAVAPARLRLAYLLSPQRQELLRTDAALRLQAEAGLNPSGQRYHLALFGDEGEAVRWLLEM